MKEHPGQISFPGGRREGGDKSLVETALREAHEEVGMAPEFVQVIGQLAPYRTITRYDVTPIIGLVDHRFSPTLDTREVDEVFEAPLAFFLEERNLQTRERFYKGKPRPYYYFDYENSDQSVSGIPDLKIPKPKQDSDYVTTLNEHQYINKLKLIKEFYGFNENSFETLSCNKIEAFSTS